MKRMITGLLTAALSLSLFTSCGAPRQEAQTEGAGEETAAAVRIAALKGPTSMGIVKMLADDQTAESPRYQAEMYTAADEIVPLIAKDEVDIALLPTNLAAALYQKTEGGVQAIDVNAAGVLYAVSHDEALTGLEDLRDRTVYMTGKGTTPEWTLRYLLEKSGLTESGLTIEFKAEPAEVVAALAGNAAAVGILPQPFATVAMMQDQELSMNFSLDDAWKAFGEQGVATGVTVVRRAFAEERPQALAQFLEDHAASVAFMADDPEEGARLVEEYGIVKAAVAQQVLTYFNPLAAAAGEEMKTWVSSYLEALYEISPDSVGGKTPDEGFYYLE